MGFDVIDIIHCIFHAGAATFFHANAQALMPLARHEFGNLPNRGWREGHSLFTRNAEHV